MGPAGNAAGPAFRVRIPASAVSTAMEMQRKIVVITILIALMLAGTSYLSPWWTLYRMRAAIDERDYKAFSSHVDFVSLRASFKSQLIANSDGEAANDNESLLDTLSGEIVSAVAGPMLDVVLGAPGVMEMINQGTPTITRAVIASAVTKVPSAEEVPAELQVKYREWGRVAFRGVEVPEQEGSFILVRGGVWSWKLAEVEVRR